MFKLILLSGTVALLAACSSTWGTRSGSGAMGASAGSYGTVDAYGTMDSETALPLRRGGPLGASGGGPN